MAIRLGIELSAAACRLVEIEGRLQPGTDAPAPRVRSFAVLPPSGPDTDAMLASLKGRDAAVVAWGTPSEHRQVVVTGASYETMRREALAVLTSVGVKTSATLGDIAPVRGASGPRRPVVVAVAAADPMFEAIRPVLAAGIRLRSLATPAMALASMAFTRRGVAAADAIEAYIAVEETSTCIALMRDGALAIARELPWGYIAEGVLRPREDIAERLALELEQYLDAVGAPSATQVCICGGVPELRTMSALLTQRLDLEVEPLDSLFGIDDARLPQPSDDFRERVAELRVAWAAAADWPPHLNLMRARHRERSRRALAAAAIVAGVTAGVGGAWRLARTEVWGSNRPGVSVVRTARSSARPEGETGTESTPSRVRPGSVPTPSRVRPGSVPPPSPPRPALPAAPPPQPLLAARPTVPRTALVASAVRPPQPTLTPTLIAALRQPPPVPAVIPAPQIAKVPEPAKAPNAAIPKPSTPPPVVARQTPPPSTQPTQPPSVATAAPRRSPALERPQAPDARQTREAAPARQASQTPRLAETPPSLPAGSGTESTPSRVRPYSVPTPSPTPPPPPPAHTQNRPAKPQPVLPLDASLETILYGADRRLAIIDGRIVGIGDMVRGARIVDISPTVIMLRDGQGRLRRLALGAGAK